LDEKGLARLWVGTPGQAPSALSSDLLAAIEDRIIEIEAGAADGRIQVVIVLTRPAGSFLGGSDLRPLRGLTRATDAAEYALSAQRVLRRLEDLTIPTVAAIEGACLGGGLELALACAFRVASDSPRTRLAFPEVRTGLIPGFGGTVRLPRLVGIPAALEMIVAGRPLGAPEAHRVGLVDAVLPADGFADVVERFARERAQKVKLRSGARRRVRRRMMEDTAPGRRLLFRRAARRMIPAATPPGAAPRRALESVAEGVALPLERAFRREAKVFGQLAVSAEAQALIHTQLLLHSTAPLAAPRAPLEQAAVLGAGEVGSAMAYLLARGQVQVRIKDRRRAAMVAGVEAARDRLARDARTGKRRTDTSIGSTIVAATGFGGFGTLDFIALAVGDDPETVRLALREAEEHTGPDCVFALTSPLVPVSIVQRATAAPARVLGFHLAEPISTFPLVEIVPGAETSSSSVARALDLARRIGRTPVVVADRPGFLLPRLIGAFFAEAIRLLDEGATIDHIDAAIVAAGFTIGPFRRMDAIGKNRALRTLDALALALGDRFAPAPVAELVRAARDGFYLYRNGRPLLPNPALPDGLPDLETEHRELIRDRIMMLVINEAALALDDGVAEPDAIDLVSVLGVGFPRSLGGVLHFAAGSGAAPLLDRFDRLASRFGPRFAPAPPLYDLAASASGHSG
jgi:3-hydroxyacyl-CoA dehydrogenase/enoyl-CoA hydratase/3-hydroxybutyryl-CoA epimerase